MKKYFFQLVGMLLFLTFFSCKKEDRTALPAPVEATKPLPTPLESSAFVAAYPKEILSFLAYNSVFENFAPEIYTGIKTYKVEYNTILNGRHILASGLIHIPDSINKSTAILSFQHGTLFKKSEAPSISSTPVALLAATGYIVIEADFIGYGSSQQVAHPYYDRSTSADVVIDLIYATKQYLKEKNIDHNRKIFLAGYSEGGYVTMAALHKIENDAAVSNLKITATAAGAGGYNLNHMLDHIMEQPIYPYPAYLGLIITGYNITYDWQKPYQYFFSNPYAEKFPDLVNGTKGGSQINAALTIVTKDLLNPDFVAELSDKNSTSDFKKALLKNSIPTWRVRGSLRLYHGDQDEILPYENSIELYNNLQTQGSSFVTFRTLSGHNHETGGEAMIFDMIPWFKSLK